MSRSILDPRLCFVCEYFDELANLTRELQLLYYYNDNSVELTEIKTRKLNLRRITCPTLSRSQFFVGGSVVIFGKVMTLTQFGDEVTRQLCEENAESTTILIGEVGFAKLGSALAVLQEECQYSIKGLKTIVVTQALAKEYQLPAQLQGKRAVVIQGVRREAVAKGLEYQQRTQGAVVARTAEEAASWAELISAVPSAASQGNPEAAVVLVKPKAVQERLAGEILQHYLNAGLSLQAVGLVRLSAQQADQLIQPYKGVLADYSATVQSLAGTLMAVQLTSNGGDTLARTREVTGPFDPAIAKALYPKSIRGRLGADRVHNVVHGADIEEDCMMYAEALF